MMTLYGMSSPNVLKIMIMLEEMGAQWRFVHVDLFSEGQFDDAFSKLNPNSKVPVLVDEDDHDIGPIFESGAILIYLAERSGRFLAASGPQRYETLKWLVLQLSTVGPLLGQLNHFVMYAPAGNDYSQTRYRTEAARIYRMLDERLAQHDWLDGSDWSIADMATYPWLDYVERHNLDRSDHPHVERWRSRIDANPAVQRARGRIAEVMTRDGAMFQAASEESKRRFFGFGKAT